MKLDYLTHESDKFSLFKNDASCSDLHRRHREREVAPQKQRDRKGAALQNRNRDIIPDTGPLGVRRGPDEDKREQPDEEGPHTVEELPAPGNSVGTIVVEAADTGHGREERKDGEEEPERARNHVHKVLQVRIVATRSILVLQDGRRDDSRAEEKAERQVGRNVASPSRFVDGANDRDSRHLFCSRGHAMRRPWTEASRVRTRCMRDPTTTMKRIAKIAKAAHTALVSSSL